MILQSENGIMEYHDLLTYKGKVYVDIKLIQMQSKRLYVINDYFPSSPHKTDPCMRYSSLKPIDTIREECKQRLLNQLNEIR
jgi:hypothetical protein